MRIPTRTIPALADVTKDISGPLPAGLLDDWAASADRSHDAARLLLAPYRRAGTVVSSDTAGLTKMTQELELLDVLWLVSEPMQTLFALGTAVGGHAVGVWQADNTEMLYPADIAASSIVDAMLEAQARIKERTRVKVGLCMHHGVFYEIGGGLFGADAQLVEQLAEDHAAGGEILVTSEVVQKVSAPSDYALLRRADLDAHHAAGVFSLVCARRAPSLVETNACFPHPYPAEFYAMLCDPSRRALAASHESGVARMVERTVVFLARHGAARSEANLASVLDDLLTNERMTAIVAETADASAHLAETAGGLSIVVFEDGASAVRFAQRIRDQFVERGLSVSVGIDFGPVLLFPRTFGRSGTIAGDPINLSSKISEDLGEPGRIRITERAAKHAGGITAPAERFEATISGVRICGLIL